MASNVLSHQEWQNYGDFFFIEHGGCLVKPGHISEWISCVEFDNSYLRLQREV